MVYLVKWLDYLNRQDWTEESFEKFSVGSLKKIGEFHRKNPDSPRDYRLTDAYVGSPCGDQPTARPVVGWRGGGLHSRNHTEAFEPNAALFGSCLESSPLDGKHGMNFYGRSTLPREARLHHTESKEGAHGTTNSESFFLSEGFLTEAVRDAGEAGLHSQDHHPAHTGRIRGRSQLQTASGRS